MYGPRFAGGRTVRKERLVTGRRPPWRLNLQHRRCQAEKKTWGRHKKNCRPKNKRGPSGKERKQGKGKRGESSRHTTQGKSRRKGHNEERYGNSVVEKFKDNVDPQTTERGAVGGHPSLPESSSKLTLSKGPIKKGIARVREKFTGSRPLNKRRGNEPTTCCYNKNAKNRLSLKQQRVAPLS